VATIRHIALYTDDADRLARFYVEVFQLEETHRMERTPTSGRSIFLTDGYMLVAIIEPRHKPFRGLHHFGFTLEGGEKEHAEIMGKLKERGVHMVTPPADRPYVEDAVWDVDGNKFDISTTGLRK
jgi:catechol 2,3-dioxygenase-like lactoylglutathione lyase family enzyme